MATALVVERNECPARRRRLDPDVTVAVIPLAALSVMSAVSIPLTPVLWATPLALAVLAPRLVFLSLAAVQTPLPLFAVVATVRLCIADPFHYRLGSLGRSRMAGSMRSSRWVPARLVSVAQRVRSGVRSRVSPTAGGRLMLLLVVVRPSGRVLACAGAAGAPFRLVAVLDVIGTIVYVVAVYVGANTLL